MLAFTIGLVPHRPSSDEAPLLMLAAAIIFTGTAISLYNRWQARGVQREIDRLDTLERPRP